MAEISGRPQTRLEPVPAWTVLTDAPLKGLALAREAGTVLAWDEGDQVYLLDLRGRHRSVTRAPGKISAGAISDNGALVALLGDGARLWLFGADLDPIAERPAPPEATAVATDAHGRYLAVGSRIRTTHFYTRHGRPAGKLETRQALAFLGFVPDRAVLVGAATQGLLGAYELRARGSTGRLDAEELWEERLMSNVGRVTTTGDGGMILASCFTHGVQRFDLRGHNEGAYHLGGTASHAVPDFAGRIIAVATLEGELAVLNSAGNVRWRSGLPRPAIALETDPLGRFLVYGHASGEVVRLDLYGDGRPAAEPNPASSSAIIPRAGAGTVRKPEWSLPLASTEEQAETAVLAVLDDPPRIGAFLSPGRLHLLTTDGRNLGQAPEITGVGRSLRTAPGWIVGATDRQVVLCDARRNTAHRADLSLVELSDLDARPDSFGLILVQERDRVGRATIAGRWVWKRELKVAIEDVAIGPDGYAALTTEDGWLRVFDPAGAPAGDYLARPPESILLIDAPDVSPPEVVWLTLARRAQMLRGHDLAGRVVWESPVAWEGWQLRRVGPFAIVSVPDGRAQVFDGAGYLRAEGKSSEAHRHEFGVDPRGRPLRVSRHGVHLICAELDGKILWRTVADEALGPLAVGTAGVAALIGRSLAWFPFS